MKAITKQLLEEREAVHVAIQELKDKDWKLTLVMCELEGHCPHCYNWHYPHCGMDYPE